MAYKHGAYGQIQAVGTRVSNSSQGVIVYIGTAPVNQIVGGANNVNVPILVNNIAEARKYFGYSDDWASFTLCEAMHVHLEQKGIGPIVLINVLDPEKHFKTTDKSVSKTPSDGAFTITNAENIDASSLTVVVTSTQTPKVEGTDYTVAYDETTHTITVTEKTAGSLGTAPLTVGYTETVVSSVSKTPSNGKITIANASEIVLDSVEVATKTKGTDYDVLYNIEKKQIIISELSSGALGTSSLTITYKSVDGANVSDTDVIGTTDGLGKNTGIYAVKNVYQVTKNIPAYMAAPGFSSLPTVHAAMYENSQKINGHWDAYMFVDMPITSGGTALDLSTAKTWKDTNGYNKPNETVFFPLAKGTDENIYHLSVLAAANFQELLLENNGIPYMTASNTACPVIANLYLGEENVGRVFDDEIINKYLNKNGIASAAYVGGRWAIWGCHSADYDQEAGDNINVAETNRMMLFYISNDFQHRRTYDVDKPMTANDLKQIISEEQTRIDALVKIGALTYGEVVLNADSQAQSDIMQGDFSFLFNVTTTPLAKSLTAVVNWTDEGFVTYFESFAA